MKLPALGLTSGLLLAGLTLAPLSAQPPAQFPSSWPMPGPGTGPNAIPIVATCPLLYVRFQAPAGSKATFYQGRAPARVFSTPAVVGMRPGYCYRMQLSFVPDHPGLSFYPTVEVRGSLKLPPRFGALSFPATIDITQADIDGIANGAVITKVIYLEHPDRARPEATKPGEILEHDMPIGSDMLGEAHLRGRPMLVVHLGERTPTAQELAAINVPGTLLLPGERVVGPAQAPPCFPSVGPGFWDPHHGPKPFEEECLHDGGDRFARAALTAEGQIGGVDPEDTVAEYRDSHGRRQLTCSNRVCLTVPRFAALRMVVPLSKTEGVIGPMDRRQVKRDVQITERQPSLLAEAVKKPTGIESRMRPGVNVATKGPGLLQGLKVLQAQQLELGPLEAQGTKKVEQLTPIQKVKLLEQMKFVLGYSQITRMEQYEAIKHTSVIGRVEGGPNVVETVLTTRDLTVCCNEAPCPPEKPLCLFKCADRGSAQPGDIVTFTLRYSNVGGRPITDVAVVDSLSPRLEYVEGSSVADRDAVFTTQPNEVGSSILRWEVTGKLLPGESGRLKFKARVR